MKMNDIITDKWNMWSIALSYSVYFAIQSVDKMFVDKKRVDIMVGWWYTITSLNGLHFSNSYLECKRLFLNEAYGQAMP